MDRIEQLQREVDLYTDILRSICGLLELPHSESGPCDGMGYYTRAIEGLQVDLAKTEADRVEHSTARYKAEAEVERLKPQYGVVAHAERVWQGKCGHLWYRRPENNSCPHCAEIERMREALLRIKALKDGYKGSDMGRVAGYRVCGEIAEAALEEFEANHPHAEGNP
jgi:hypothetical protein